MKEAINVLFLMEKTDEENMHVFAYFPKMFYNKELYKTTFTSYSHIGQHSGCHEDYANEKTCKKKRDTKYILCK